jgi:hypothetical protein
MTTRAMEIQPVRDLCELLTSPNTEGAHQINELEAKIGKVVSVDGPRQ